jgi:NitT/TauT family transport system permease protein
MGAKKETEKLKDQGIDPEMLELLQDKPKTGATRSKRQVVLILLVFVTGVILWEGFISLFNYPEYILPRPWHIGLSLWEGIVSQGLLWYEIGYTLLEVIVGFFIGAGLGLILGIWIALSPTAEMVFYPYIVAVNSLPKVAIAPLFVIWLGIGYPSRVAIAATLCVFPMLVNTFTGLRTTAPQLLLFLRSVSATRWQIFVKVQFPNALPFIFAGLNLAIVLSVIGAIVGEMISGIHGLGSVLIQKNFALDTAAVFAILVILGMMGSGLLFLMDFIRKKVIFWSEQEITISV